jgi:hypothetical protein
MQKTAICGWGKDFVARAEVVNTGLREWLRTLSCITIWTDFAGGEAPIWALEEMGLKINHVACSEIAAGPQKFLFRNVKPPVFYNNMFERIHADPQPQPPHDPFLMTSGFPCRAFSWLRSGSTGLMNDVEARGCWEMLETAKVTVCKNPDCTMRVAIIYIYI